MDKEIRHIKRGIKKMIIRDFKENSKNRKFKEFEEHMIKQKHALIEYGIFNKDEFDKIIAKIRNVKNEDDDLKFDNALFNADFDKKLKEVKEEAKEEKLDDELYFIRDRMYSKF